jgi:CRISPR-associated protein Cmr1
MFLTGANLTEAELRAASLKGALRFWWRAMQGGITKQSYKEKSKRILTQAKQEKINYNKPPEVMAALEAEIFGHAGDTNRNIEAKKSCFSIQVKTEQIKTKKPDFLGVKKDQFKIEGRGFRASIREYASYGLYENTIVGQNLQGKAVRKNVYKSEIIEVAQEFGVILRFYTDNIAKIKEVINAFYCLQYFGGLGSKSRNGFGSFSIISYKCEGSNEEINVSLRSNGFESFYKDIINIKVRSGLSSYTAFSHQSVLYCAKEKFNSADEAHSFILKLYRDLKINGAGDNTFRYEMRRRLVAPIEINGNFLKDVKSTVFDKKMKDGKVKSIRMSDLERHAKPFFLSIVKQNDIYRALILVLPYDYLAGYANYLSGNNIKLDCRAFGWNKVYTANPNVVRLDKYYQNDYQDAIKNCIDFLNKQSDIIIIK